MAKDKVICSYKGFDKDMRCQGFQYKEGKEYKHAGDVVCCPSDEDLKLGKGGFHACEYPLDVFGHYHPAYSVYHEVEQSGETASGGDDTKIASTVIKIGAKIDIKGLIKASFDYVKERCTNTKSGKDRSALNGGDRSALNGGNWSALNGGDRSALNGGDWSALNGGDSSALNGGNWSALNGGDWSALNGGYSSALNGGDWSALNGGSESKLTGGKFSVVYGRGQDAQVRGGIGAVLALTEFDNEGDFKKVHVHAVDGKKIKANTFYTLKNGKFAEVKL